MIHIWHSLHIDTFVMFIDCHMIVQLSVTLRTTNDSTRSQKHCLLALLRRHIQVPLFRTCCNDAVQSPAIPSHAELDMCKVMHAAGGPNYKTVLHDTDIHMGQIPRISQASNVVARPGEPI